MRDAALAYAWASPRLPFAGTDHPCNLHRASVVSSHRCRNSIMQKNMFRFFAWTCAIAVLWAIWQDAALAQGNEGVLGAVEELPDEGFFGPILHSIFTFDTSELFRILSKPQYSIPAF